MFYTITDLTYLYNTTKHQSDFAVSLRIILRCYIIVTVVVTEIKPENSAQDAGWLFSGYSR